MELFIAAAQQIGREGGWQSPSAGLGREAFAVFEEGVRKHYYSRTDIDPITTFIRQHLPVKTG